MTWVRKKCNQCGKTKDADKFDVRRGTKNGLKSYCKECCKNLQLIAKYGISLQDYRAMKKSQRGRCYLCKTKPEKLHIDHCHIFGQVRKLLCHSCNYRLGFLEDLEWAERALQYIKDHRGPLPL